MTTTAKEESGLFLRTYIQANRIPLSRFVLQKKKEEKASSSSIKIWLD